MSQKPSLVGLRGKCPVCLLYFRTAHSADTPIVMLAALISKRNAHPAGISTLIAISSEFTNRA